MADLNEGCKLDFAKLEMVASEDYYNFTTKTRSEDIMEWSVSYIKDVQ
jgi:hypothetical protein